MSRELVVAGRIGPVKDAPDLLAHCRSITLQVADRRHQRVLSNAQLINPTGLYPELLSDAQVFTLRRMFAELHAVLQFTDQPQIEETP